MVRTAASNYVAAQPQIKKVTQIFNQISFRGNAGFNAPPIPVWVMTDKLGMSTRSPHSAAVMLGTATRLIPVVQTVLCRLGLQLGTKAPALDRLRIAPQHLKLRLPAIAPEANVESMSADS
jgi:hypothetical protein